MILAIILFVSAWLRLPFILGGFGLGEKEVITRVEREKNWQISGYSVERQQAKTLWDWIVQVAIPLAVWFVGHQFQVSESIKRDQQKQLDNERLEEDAIRSYLKDLIDLTAKTEAGETLPYSGKDTATHAMSLCMSIRILTLDVLSYLSIGNNDGGRKGRVIFMLVNMMIPRKLKIDLSVANLQGAILHGMDLQEANFIGANLVNAKLGGADLRKSKLNEAELQDANLLETKLQGANLEAVGWNAKTEWPDPKTGAFEGAINIPPALKEKLEEFGLK